MLYKNAETTSTGENDSFYSRILLSALISIDFCE